MPTRREKWLAKKAQEDAEYEEWLKVGLPFRDQHGKLVRIDTFNYESRRYNWPYCIQRLKDGRHVVLNRDYKPLNIYANGSCDDWFKKVRYEDFARYLPQLTDAVMDKLHHNCNKRHADSCHLYNDGSKPESSAKCRKEYVERLVLLADILREGNDKRDWKEMFNGHPRIWLHKCRLDNDEKAAV